MKIGDRIEKTTTKAHYKIIEFKESSGAIVAQRLISGGKSDNIIEIPDMGGYKLIKEDENVIGFFDGDYDFLSNFYEFPVEYEGITYNSNEHAFQAAKTFSTKEKETVRNASTPSRAKYIGRSVTLRDDWELIKFDILYNICVEKFKNEDLRNKLLNTGDMTLIEGNTWNDNTYGNCICSKCQNIVGKNELGKILMRIREELKVN